MAKGTHLILLPTNPQGQVKSVCGGRGHTSLPVSTGAQPLSLKLLFPWVGQVSPSSQRPGLPWVLYSSPDPGPE